MKPVSVAELKGSLESVSPPRVLAVLAPDTGPVVAGAETASVYEMVFLDTVATLIPENSAPIVVHDSGEPFDRAAMTAAAKLEEVGYRDVRVLEGGLAAWVAAGGATDGSVPETPRLESVSGQFAADLARSKVHWTGRNLANHHTGELSLGAGEIVLEKGLLRRASFEIDMESLVCTDLRDQKLNALLVAHLKDEDFFGVTKYPRARFETRNATPIPVGSVGQPNVRVSGDLTLKGVTQPVDFDATVALTTPTEVVAQAFLSIDRTRWGVLYGSSRFFARLGGHLVSDEIHLHLKIAATLRA